VSLQILISGAGIGGLTAALALAQNGVAVDVLEQAPLLGEVGAGLQQGPNAMHVHAALGLDAAVRAASFEPDSIEFRDYKTGKSLLSNPLKGAHEQRYGQKYLHIHRADLIRRQMLGPEKNVYTGNVAWRGIVPTSKLPIDHIPPCANNWLGPKRHFVSYYIRGGDYINFVAIEERDEWTEENWSQRGDMNKLRAAFSGWDSRVTDLLNACEDCHLWGLFDHPPLAGWTEGRVALLGDAAHPMLPFLAQGASMAIEDGWVLAQSLSAHKDEAHRGLKAYEAARYARATHIQALSRENAKLYHMRSPAQTLLRNTKFKIATHIPAAAHSKLDKVFGVNVVKEFPKNSDI